MRRRLKLWAGTSVLALLSQGAVAWAQDWQARTVEDIQSSIETTEGEGVRYTVQYGDTLSTIAEAMGIHTETLATINEIEEIDLIFPDTILVAGVDAYGQVDSLAVEAPDGSTHEVAIAVNLTPTEQISEQQAEINTTSAQPVVATIPEWTEGAVVADEELPVTVPVEQAEDIYQDTTVDPNEVVNDQQGMTEETAEIAPDEPGQSLEEPVESQPEVQAPAEETPADSGSTIDEPIEDPSIEIPVVTNPEEEQPVEEPVYEEPQEEQPVEEPAYEEPTTVDPSTNPSNAGLSPEVATFKEEVAATYGITDFSGYRPGDTGDHGSGKAIDFIVPVGSQLGDDVANYAINSMGNYDISYVIWEQQIYGDWNQQWTSMEDRGSVTANHYDHVHVSFN